MTRMLMGPGESAWRRTLGIAVVSELLYLLYFHVAASAPHSVDLFSWLPFGNWTATTPGEVSWLYVLCLGGLFALYGLALKDLSLRPEAAPDRRLIFLAAAGFGLTLLFVPSLLSKDLFDYMGHARVLAQHGANPYTTPASTFPPDEFTRAMGWSGSTPLYGPAWTSLAALIALPGAGLVATAVIFKLLFIATHLLNGWLVMVIARELNRKGGRQIRPLRAAAFYLWNPLVLTQVAADAHNDGVALTWLLLGILLLCRNDDFMGAACAAMSVLVKYITAPVVLLLLVERLRAKGAGRALALAGICAATAAIAYGPYLGGISAVHFLRPYEHSSYQGGFMMLAEMATGWVLGGSKGPGSPTASVMLALTGLAALALGAWYVRACFRTRTLRDSLENATWLLLLYLLFVTALLRTSYLVWVVGLGALAVPVVLRRTVALFSASVLALEVFWVYRILQPSVPPDIARTRFLATVVAVGVPIIYLLARSRWSPWGKRAVGEEQGA